MVKTLIIYSVLIVLICVFYWKFQQDDAYIFYSYAKNLSQGNGFVFNPGEKINAVTSPLYTLILALIYSVLGSIISIPVWGFIIGGISMFLICFFSQKIFLAYNYRTAADIFPFIFLATPLLKNSMGMETFLLLALAVISIYFFVTDSFYLSFGFASLAVTARYDAGLLLLILAVILIVKSKRLDSIKFFIPAVVILIAWFGFSYSYFRELLPSSFYIKTAQTAMGSWGEGFLFFQGFLSAIPGGYYSALVHGGILLLALIFSVIKIWNERFLFIIFIWFVLHTLIYGFLLNPPGYPWYYTIYAFPIAFITAVALDGLYKFKIKNYVIGFLGIIFIAASLYFPYRVFSGDFNSKYYLYKNSATWLNKFSPDRSILIDEIGIIRYYYQTGIVKDMLGLVNPIIKKDLENGEYQKAAASLDPDVYIVEYPNPPSYFNFSKNITGINNTIISGGYLKARIIKLR